MQNSYLAKDCPPYPIGLFHDLWNTTYNLYIHLYPQNTTATVTKNTKKLMISKHNLFFRTCIHNVHVIKITVCTGGVFHDIWNTLIYLYPLGRNTPAKLRNIPTQIWFEITFHTRGFACTFHISRIIPSPLHAGGRGFRDLRNSRWSRYLSISSKYASKFM